MTIEPSPVLEGAKLTRTFGTRRAVNDVSFSLVSGEFCALLGPNGAGKTTLIKMLTGLLQPDGGEIRYMGEPYSSDRLALKRLIGVVPQHNNLDRELSCAENLRVHGLLYGMRGQQLSSAIDRSLAFAELMEQREVTADKLSGGMKRRLVIARALMHRPRILFLDEPSVGLDPHSRRSMWQFLSRINRAQECTILLTTHYLEEAERLANRVLFIDKGRVIADGDVTSLTQTLGPFVLERVGEGNWVEFFDSRELALARLGEIEESGSVRPTTLEDAFLQMTGTRLVTHG
ncbi:ABC transporter ATP-binding protein [Ferrimonas futtsuensis]|uniref:ABC transporter ATP-binding protein n=1 Tax=Ferrimonas futtsuensis TaxID=364764 RepID=UPI0004850E88|nr:ABC transporter ATP-binding protein [Ferrimonas futtsuensis]